MIFLACLVAFSEPEILTRAEWGAKPPVLPMEEHRIRTLTIHHAGTPSKPATPNVTKLRNLQAWCQREDKLGDGRTKPAWPDIPYHYYIFADGQVAEAREWRFAGDTNTAYDPRGHLLVCLEGNFEVEQPTPAQLESLRRTVAWLRAKHKILRSQIGGHSDYADTACPGKNLMPHVLELKRG